MRVLVACEFSGVVRDAFIRRGHNAWSCDLRSCESPLSSSSFDGHSYHHFKMDVLEVLAGNTLQGKTNWNLLIAHPPCTFLTNAGVRWLYKKQNESIPALGKDACIQTRQRDQDRWRQMELAAALFRKLLNSPIPRICVENPIMHLYARGIIAAPYTQIIHPWQFGHAETKATCLWLKGLPPLVPTKIIKPDYKKYPAGKGNGFEPRVHHTSPSPKSDPDRRERERSRTLTGIAEAMAEQWGSL